MMNLQEYMKAAKVSKKKYVDAWIDKDYIPKALRDTGSNTYQFVDSSRRPYQGRGLKPGLPADKLRTHIVKAALARQYISHNILYMSEKEYQGMIDNMVQLGLIKLREEDGVTYIDSTIKSEEYMNKTFKEINQFISTTIESISAGTTRALS